MISLATAPPLASLPIPLPKPNKTEDIVPPDESYPYPLILHVWWSCCYW